MWALPIVVSDVLSKDSLNVAFAEDQDVVQTLPPDDSHEAFGKGVCLGRAGRGADDLHALLSGTPHRTIPSTWRRGRGSGTGLAPSDLR